MGRLPRKSTFAGDVLEIVLNDQAGEAAAKGVQNKPSTNDEIGNHNPSDTPVVYHDAPFCTCYEDCSRRWSLISCLLNSIVVRSKQLG